MTLGEKIYSSEKKQYIVRKEKIAIKLEVEVHRSMGYMHRQLRHSKAWLRSKVWCFGNMTLREREERYWDAGVVGQQQRVCIFTWGAIMAVKWFSDSQAPHVSFVLRQCPPMHLPCSRFWAHRFSHLSTSSRGKKESVKLASPCGGHSVTLTPLGQPGMWAPVLTTA